MQKHTPGPKECEQCGYVHGEVPANPLPCGCAVMAINKINWDGTRMEAHHEHVQHCALHKAAPDMLEALENAMRAIKDDLNGADNENGLRMAVSKAEAAIAKAKGE